MRLRCIQHSGALRRHSFLWRACTAADTSSDVNDQASLKLHIGTSSQQHAQLTVPCWQYQRLGVKDIAVMRHVAFTSC